MGWATFWAILSQTRLVTLFVKCVFAETGVTGRDTKIKKDIFFHSKRQDWVVVNKSYVNREASRQGNRKATLPTTC
jgi:hypothetical protein